jgi:hypothetical protein
MTATVSTAMAAPLIVLSRISLIRKTSAETVYGKQAKSVTMAIAPMATVAHLSAKTKKRPVAMDDGKVLNSAMMETSAAVMAAIVAAL